MLSWFKSLWISPWTVTFGLPQQFLHNFYHVNYRAVRTVGGCRCAVSIWCSIACRGNRGGRGVIPCTACQCLHTCAWARTLCLKQEHRKTKLTPINTNIAENTKMLLCGGLKNKLPGTFSSLSIKELKFPISFPQHFLFHQIPQVCTVRARSWCDTDIPYLLMFFLKQKCSLFREQSFS